MQEVKIALVTFIPWCHFEHTKSWKVNRLTIITIIMIDLIINSCLWCQMISYSRIHMFALWLACKLVNYRHFTKFFLWFSFSHTRIHWFLFSLVSCSKGYFLLLSHSPNAAFILVLCSNHHFLLLSHAWSSAFCSGLILQTPLFTPVSCSKGYFILIIVTLFDATSIQMLQPAFKVTKA